MLSTIDSRAHGDPSNLQDVRISQAMAPSKEAGETAAGKKLFAQEFYNLAKKS